MFLDGSVPHCPSDGAFKSWTIYPELDAFYDVTWRELWCKSNHCLTDLKSSSWKCSSLWIVERKGVPCVGLDGLFFFFLPIILFFYFWKSYLLFFSFYLLFFLLYLLFSLKVNKNWSRRSNYIVTQWRYVQNLGTIIILQHNRLRGPRQPAAHTAKS